MFERNFQAFLSSGTSDETLAMNSILKTHEGFTTVQKWAVKSYHLGEGNISFILKVFHGYNKAYFVFHIIKVHILPKCLDYLY